MASLWYWYQPSNELQAYLCIHIYIYYLFLFITENDLNQFIVHGLFLDWFSHIVYFVSSMFSLTFVRCLVFWNVVVESFSMGSMYISISSYMSYSIFVSVLEMSSTKPSVSHVTSPTLQISQTMSVWNTKHVFPLNVATESFKSQHTKVGKSNPRNTERQQIWCVWKRGI